MIDLVHRIGIYVNVSLFNTHLLFFVQIMFLSLGHSGIHLRPLIPRTPSKFKMTKKWLFTFPHSKTDKWHWMFPNYFLQINTADLWHLTSFYLDFVNKAYQYSFGFNRKLKISWFSMILLNFIVKLDPFKASVFFFESQPNKFIQACS